MGFHVKRLYHAMLWWYFTIYTISGQAYHHLPTFIKL